MSLEKAKADLDKKVFWIMDRTCRFDSNGRRGGGGAWRRTGNDREDDVILQGDAPVLILTEGTAKD